MLILFKFANIKAIFSKVLFHTSTLSNLTDSTSGVSVLLTVSGGVIWYMSRGNVVYICFEFIPYMVYGLSCSNPVVYEFA